MNNTCNCFLCRNSDNNDMLFGYLFAQIEEYIYLLNLLLKMNVHVGSIGDKDLGGEMAALEYNLIGSLDYLEEIINRMKNKISKENKEEFKKIFEKASSLLNLIRK